MASNDSLLSSEMYFPNFLKTFAVRSILKSLRSNIIQTNIAALLLAYSRIKVKGVLIEFFIEMITEGNTFVRSYDGLLCRLRYVSYSIV